MANTKKRSPRKNTYPFLVSGPVPRFVNEIYEWTSAVSEKQALLQVKRKLEALYPHMRIYLGDCTVTKGEPPSPKALTSQRKE